MAKKPIKRNLKIVDDDTPVAEQQAHESKKYTLTQLDGDVLDYCQDAVKVLGEIMLDTEAKGGDRVRAAAKIIDIAKVGVNANKTPELASDDDLILALLGGKID